MKHSLEVGEMLIKSAMVRNDYQGVLRILCEAFCSHSSFDGNPKIPEYLVSHVSQFLRQFPEMVSYAGCFDRSHGVDLGYWHKAIADLLEQGKYSEAYSLAGDIHYKFNETQRQRVRDLALAEEDYDTALEMCDEKTPKDLTSEIKKKFILDNEDCKKALDWHNASEVAFTPSELETLLEIAIEKREVEDAIGFVTLLGREFTDEEIGKFKQNIAQEHDLHAAEKFEDLLKIKFDVEQVKLIFEQLLFDHSISYFLAWLAKPWGLEFMRRAPKKWLEDWLKTKNISLVGGIIITIVLGRSITQEEILKISQNECEKTLNSNRDIVCAIRYGLVSVYTAKLLLDNLNLDSLYRNDTDFEIAELIIEMEKSKTLYYKEKPNS